MKTIYIAKKYLIYKAIKNPDYYFGTIKTNGSKSHKIGSKKYTKRLNSIIESKFIHIPTLTMSGIRKYPDPKTTALGGVATGNINAHVAATVAETIKINGCTSIVIAIGYKIGNNIAVVAKFEVISVKKLTAAIKMKTNKNKEIPSNKVI